MAFCSSASIRNRCSARAISSLWTLDVSESNSVVNSRLCTRSARISLSRSDLEISNRSRSVAAFAMEDSIWINASYEASATPCAVSAASPRCSLRLTALVADSRSFCAAASSALALAAKAVTLSSKVRRFNRASTSADRAAETFERRSSRWVKSGFAGVWWDSNCEMAALKSASSDSRWVLASTSEAKILSTSPCAFLTFWPATAICSARPDILASDSFNLASANS